MTRPSDAPVVLLADPVDRFDVEAWRAYVERAKALGADQLVRVGEGHVKRLTERQEQIAKVRPATE